MKRAFDEPTENKKNVKHKIKKPKDRRAQVKDQILNGLLSFGFIILLTFFPS